MRYFLLSGHYRSQLNYTEENLKQARSARERMYTALRGTDKSAVPAGGDEFKARFIEAMMTLIHLKWYYLIWFVKLTA